MGFAVLHVELEFAFGFNFDWAVENPVALVARPVSLLQFVNPVYSVY